MLGEQELVEIIDIDILPHQTFLASLKLKLNQFSVLYLFQNRLEATLQEARLHGI